MKRKIEIELDTETRKVKMDIKTEFKDETIEKASCIIKSNMTDEEIIGYIFAMEQSGMIDVIGTLKRVAALETAREIKWREKWKEIKKAQGLE